MHKVQGIRQLISFFGMFPIGATHSSPRVSSGGTETLAIPTVLALPLCMDR